jgi:hypothetical protein
VHRTSNVLELSHGDVSTFLHLWRALEGITCSFDRVDGQPALDPTLFFVGSGRQSELLSIEGTSTRGGDVVITFVGSEYGAAGWGLVDYSGVRTFMAMPIAMIVKPVIKVLLGAVCRRYTLWVVTSVIGL